MFWADAVAEKLKKRKLPLEWVDDMKTPSGRIHVGALRGVVIHDLAHKALKDLGVYTKFTYVFEDQDPMDSLPVYLPAEKFEHYMGKPLFTIPSPESGYKNYAEYYALEFQHVFETIGSHPEIIWVTDLYKAGKMNHAIKVCLDNASEVRKIYEETYKKPLPENWYPFQVYCPECGKVSTTRVSDWDGTEVEFECRVEGLDWTKGCGAAGTVSPFSDSKHIAGKLPWKVEWPAKWQVIGVTVEGGGKDHMSAGGSYDVSSQIAKRVLKFEPPYPLPYEFFLVGGKKMSSSKGRGTSAREMLDILPPEILRFLMVKTDINQAINFDPGGDTIPKLFDEYQEYGEHFFLKKGDDYARIFELSQVGEVKKPPKIRFGTLTQWVQMPNKHEEIKKSGAGDWIQYAHYWVEHFAPEQEKFLIQEKLPESAKNLSEDQKKYLKNIAGKIKEAKNADDFQVTLYEASKEEGISAKDAFGALYTAFLGKKSGPKASWLLLSLDQNFVKKRIEEVVNAESGTMPAPLRGARPGNQESEEEHSGFHKPEIFSIDSTLKEKFPSISVGVAIIKGVTIQKTNPDLENEKEKLLESFQDLTTEQLGQYSEIQSYRKLYKEMGIDWHSRRPSPEALLRRVALKKGLYTINTCVDAYNLIVMRHKVSIGAFDLEKLEFPTLLRLAKTGEKILLLGDDEETEYKEGEIAYFDKAGGFNIDFNYRDSQRTAVKLETKNLYINVDGVYDITPLQVEKSLKEAVDLILKYCGGVIAEFGVVDS